MEESFPSFGSCRLKRKICMCGVFGFESISFVKGLHESEVNAVKMGSSLSESIAQDEIMARLGILVMEA